MAQSEDIKRVYEPQCQSIAIGADGWTEIAPKNDKRNHIRVCLGDGTIPVWLKYNGCNSGHIYLDAETGRFQHKMPDESNVLYAGAIHARSVNEATTVHITEY